jgi:hypothetical protein
MKTRKIYSLLIVLMLFAAGAFMYACTPDGDRDNISPKSLSESVEELECQNCLDAPLDLIQRVGRNGNVVLGTVEVCVVEDELCFRYAAAGGTIGSVKIGIYGSLVTIQEQNSTPAPKSFNFDSEHLNPRLITYDKCIPLDDIAVALGYTSGENLNGITLYIIAEAQISGGGGTTGGQAWAGTLVNNKKYPFDRYFTFTVGCAGPPINNTCLFTQGYWFAKPNVVWPGCNELNYQSCGNVEIGGVSYSRQDAREIFNSSNKWGKTDLKQAWLQAAALQLSLDNNPDLREMLENLEEGEDCFGILTDLEDIHDYFNGKGIQSEGTLNRTSPKDGSKTNSDLRAAADRISKCLTTHDAICDYTNVVVL